MTSAWALALQISALMLAGTLLIVLMLARFVLKRHAPAFAAYLLLALHACIFWAVVVYWRFTGITTPTLFLSLWSIFLQAHVWATLLGLTLADITATSHE